MKSIIKLSVFGMFYMAFHTIFMLQMVGAKGLTMDSGITNGIIIAMMLIFGFLFLKRLKKIFKWLYNAIIR